MRVARINVAPASAYRLLAAATTATGLEPGLEAELRALLALNPATPDAERESARQRALDLAPVEDLPHVRALVALGDGHRAARRGQFEEAIQRLGAALAPLRAQDALSLVGPAYVMQFLVLMSAGHGARTAESAREAVAYATTSGQPEFLEAQAVNVGASLYLLGEFTQFDEVMRPLAGEHTPLYGGVAASRAMNQGDFEAARSTQPQTALAGGIPGFLAMVHAARARIAWLAELQMMRPRRYGSS
jgi:hypothetical protein